MISDLICGCVFVSCKSGEPTIHVVAFQPVSTLDCWDVKHFAQRKKSTDSYTWIQRLVTEGRPHSGQRFVPTSVLWCPSPHTPVYYTFSQYLKACLGKYQELSGLLAAGNLTPPQKMYHDQQALAKITNQLPGTRLLRTAKRSPRNVSLTPASLYAQPDLRRSNKYTLPPIILRLVRAPYNHHRPRANHRWLHPCRAGTGPQLSWRVNGRVSPEFSGAKKKKNQQQRLTNTIKELVSLRGIKDT